VIGGFGLMPARNATSADQILQVDASPNPFFLFTAATAVSYAKSSAGESENLIS
jgi:hypothetical protein